MLKREDLEGLGWKATRATTLADGEFDYAVFEPGGAIVGEFFGRVGPPAETRPAQEYAALASSSPELALACLRLREYVLGVYDGNYPRAAETGNALRIVDAALEAAGVEVEP